MNNNNFKGKKLVYLGEFRISQSCKKVARGRPCKSYINQLANDTGCLEQDLSTLIADKKEETARFRRTPDINSTC